MRIFFVFSLFLVFKSPVCAIATPARAPQCIDQTTIWGSEASLSPVASSAVVSGETLGIISILTAVFTVLLWFVSIEAAIFASLPLGILGLTLGFIGRKKARKWRQGKKAKRLCTAGIFLNTLTSGAMLLLILLFALYSKGQH